MKVLCAAFLKLHFGFEIFWLKNICTKAAHKMMMQLTIGCIDSNANITN